MEDILCLLFLSVILLHNQAFFKDLSSQLSDVTGLKEERPQEMLGSYQPGSAGLS